MYSLFTKVIESHGSIIKPPGYELIKRTYQSNIRTITDYYKDKVFYTNNTHILVRILNTFSIPLEYPIDSYMNAAYVRSDYIGKLFKLTSEITYGDIHKGIFYGPNIREIILSNDEYFSIYNTSNWKDIQAVKVLNHPISDLNCIIPNGKENSSASGLATISINIPLLLFQYRYYLLNQQDLKGTITKGANHFVSSYVLPNMLYSHLEIAILNRLMNKVLNIPNSEPIKKYVFYLTNYTDRIDKELNYIYNKIHDVSINYSNTLKNTPSIFKEDMQECLVMPSMVRSRQVWWSLLISRLDIIYFLLIVGGEKGLVYNRTLINKLKIDVKRLVEENIIESLLPDYLYKEIEYKLIYILNV